MVTLLWSHPYGLLWSHPQGLLWSHPRGFYGRTPGASMVTPLGLSMDTCPEAFKCQFSIFHYDDNFQPSFCRGALHGPWSHVGDLAALTEIFGPPLVNRGFEPTEIIEFLSKNYGLSKIADYHTSGRFHLNDPSMSPDWNLVLF